MLELVVIFLVCALSGVLTGLLGIGGGLIIVPAFLLVLPWFGLNFDIHQIIGVSATCVFLNSITSVFYRRKEDFMPNFEVAKIAAAIIFGTLLGVYLSNGAPKEAILSIYLFVAAISIYLIKQDIRYNLNQNHFLKYASFAMIGAISAAIGIGGAVMFAVALKCFSEKNTKQLLPTITLLVAIHAVFAFIGKVVVGDVILMIIPLAFLASIIGAKIGIRISKKLTSNAISNLMIVALLLGGLRIVIEFYN